MQKEVFKTLIRGGQEEIQDVETNWQIIILDGNG